ncbi:MAG: GxxExxY protein [Bacteroidales bacterium]|nr:GxxExxY protein [Bacteroidales bacterium]
MTSFCCYKDIVYQIIGAAMTVHQKLGWGLLEAVYNEALCLELGRRGIVANPEVPIKCYYDGIPLKKEYKADVLVGDILVELKSTIDIIPKHRAQLFNYLRLTQKPIGLLINFGEPSLHGERYGLDAETNVCYLLGKDMMNKPIPYEYFDSDIDYLEDSPQ